MAARKAASLACRGGLLTSRVVFPSGRPASEAASRLACADPGTLQWTPSSPGSTQHTLSTTAISTASLQLPAHWWPLAGGAPRTAGFHSGRATPSAAAGVESTGVVAVETSAEFDSAIREAPSTQLVIVDFTASWCMPCQRIAPFLNELSVQHSQLKILKVDIDKAELQDVVESARVSAVPTFKFFKAGKLLSTFSGADQKKLADTVELLLRA